MLLIVGLTASIVHILHLTFPSNKTMTKIDTLGQLIVDEMRRVFPQPPPSTPTPAEIKVRFNDRDLEPQTLSPVADPIVAQNSSAQAAFSAASVVGKAVPIAIAMLIAFGGCGPSARHQALTAAVATVTASETALMTYNHQHEIEIASNQSISPEQRHEKLIAYRATRDKVEFAIDLAWRALGIAGPLNDDTSLINVKLAVSQVVSVVATFIHGGAQ